MRHYLHHWHYVRVNDDPYKILVERTLHVRRWWAYLLGTTCPESQARKHQFKQRCCICKKERWK